MKKPIPTRNRALPNPTGFTLIELLAVIAIIALLAGMLFPVTRAVARIKARTKARAELAQVQTAIEAYKMKLGQYPPDNPGRPGTNQLYYELMGTIAAGNSYNIDGRQGITLPSTDFPGVSGIVNCTRASDEEAAKAVRFLTALKSNQIGQIDGASVLICTVPFKNPDGTQVQSPIRYRSTNPVHNQNSYDLWIYVAVDGKINRISNWSRDPEVVYEPGL